MLERVEITASAQTHCRRRAQAFFNCGFIINAARCERDHSTWSDDVLEAVDSCLGSPCAGLATCLDGAYP
jgi:hypothetical protein